jgi:hypothetical protein
MYFFVQSKKTASRDQDATSSILHARYYVAGAEKNKKGRKKTGFF